MPSQRTFLKTASADLHPLHAGVRGGTCSNLPRKEVHLRPQAAEASPCRGDVADEFQQPVKVVEMSRRGSQIDQLENANNSCLSFDCLQKSMSAAGASTRESASAECLYLRECNEVGPEPDNSWAFRETA